MATQVLRIKTHVSDDLSLAIQAFFSYCASKNLSENTITYYRYRLQAFQQFCAQSEMPVTPGNTSTQLLREFLTHETQVNSSTTANHSSIALRTFFNFLVKDGFLNENPMDGVERIRRRRTVIETFTSEQIEKILTTCGRNFVGIRDRAIISVLLDCGLRVTELCTLTLRDISWTEQMLTVVGKGDIERVVPFGQGARQALTQYLTRRGELDTEALFVSCYGVPLNRYRAREILLSRCTQAGITGVRCSPHTFRHTCAVWYLRNGGDVFSLQRLLGHSDLAMTKRYCDSLSAADVQKKHRECSPVDNMKLSKPTIGRKRLR